MKLQDSSTFSLNNFEGPLDLLWHLIQRDEIDIYEISLKQITEQFIEKLHQLATLDVDHGAEFIALAASLVLLKSKTLLPKHEQQDESQEEELDPRFEIIHQLLDYCRFKQAAKDLAEREAQQIGFYSRGVDSDVEAKKNLGIDHISLDDLAALFQQVLSKVTIQKGTIHEEEWRVSDKITFLKALIILRKTLLFTDVFTVDQSRAELIVTFLALLELMKIGEARVGIDRALNAVCILSST